MKFELMAQRLNSVLTNIVVQFYLIYERCQFAFTLYPFRLKRIRILFCRSHNNMVRFDLDPGPQSYESKLALVYTYQFLINEKKICKIQHISSFYGLYMLSYESVRSRYFHRILVAFV